MDGAEPNPAETIELECHRPKPTYQQSQFRSNVLEKLETDAGMTTKAASPSNEANARNDSSHRISGARTLNRAESAPMPHYTNVYEDLEGEGRRETNHMRPDVELPPSPDFNYILDRESRTSSQAPSREESMSDVVFL